MEPTGGHRTGGYRRPPAVLTPDQLLAQPAGRVRDGLGFAQRLAEGESPAEAGDAFIGSKEKSEKKGPAHWFHKLWKRLFPGKEHKKYVA